MQYKILNKDKKKTILQRLFEIRNIEDSFEDFLNPSWKKYRHNPFLLNDMQKSVDRILEAIKKEERIMIFWDYDVDGVTSSFILYSFFTEHLNYKNISVMFPNRIEDGYWLKSKHLDIMKEKWINLIITVDNGITSIEEAIYSKKTWIDLIITDHHEVVNKKIPEAFAVINPKVSPNYPFSNLCGAWVAFKLLNAILENTKFDKNTKKSIFSLYLPIVAIATVADIVPLVNENRIIVAKWLAQMSTKQNLLPSLSGFLDFLNLKKVDTYHIWFVIGPRINAWWRIASPYDSFYALLFNGEKQKEKLTMLDDINTKRRAMQETAIKIAKKEVDPDQKLVFVANEEFHEWVVGIVAGRLTDQNYKPSVILKIQKEKWIAVGSLRGPDYFDAMKMIESAHHLLERSWWHKRAWWLSVKLKNLEKLKEKLQEYCNKTITEEDMVRTITVDSLMFENERNEKNLSQIEKLGPYGEWNQEPIFCLPNCEIISCSKVWQRWKWHLKLKVKFGDNEIQIMKRSKWDKLEEYENIHINTKRTFYGKIKKSDFDWNRFLDCIWVE